MENIFEMFFEARIEAENWNFFLCRFLFLFSSETQAFQTFKICTLRACWTFRWWDLFAQPQNRICGQFGGLSWLTAPVQKPGGSCIDCIPSWTRRPGSRSLIYQIPSDWITAMCSAWDCPWTIWKLQLIQDTATQGIMNASQYTCVTFLLRELH